MERLASAALGGAPGLGSLLIAGSVAVLTLGYFYLFWDRRKDDSPNKDDGQVGIKLALFTMLLVGLGIAAGGVETILGYVLAGAKNVTGQRNAGPIKAGIASLVAGGAGMAAVIFLFLPRTNAKDYPQAERFAVGAVAVLAGIATVLGLEAMLKGFFGALPGWPPKAYALANLLVAGGVAFLAINRLGALSGWQAPSKAATPQQFQQPGGYQQQQQQAYQQQQQAYQQQQQQQQAYQQPQGGYQQQPQGGYQQQQPQGAYPQPQAGSPGLPPPQGGGYPPQGGGYPPR